MSVDPGVTVVVHTFERPEFLEEDVAAGRWSGIPLLISDDGSSADVWRRLQDIAASCGAHAVRRERNGGVACAARDGVAAASTRFVMLCGDDDYLAGFERFAAEAKDVLSDESVLFVAMPEIRTLEEGRLDRTQYDRRVFDGMTGLELLRELVFSGEMQALQAGTLFRRDDLLAHTAEPVFRTSEDYVLLARLCAAHPERRVRVLDSGAYMRRVHERSLSHATAASTARTVLNLMALVVAARNLDACEELAADVVAGLVRQRATVLSAVYGEGREAARAVSALVRGEVPTHGAEPDAALTFLASVSDQLPRELADWQPLLGGFRVEQADTSAMPRLDEVTDAVERGDVVEAKALIERFPEARRRRDPDLLVHSARVAWIEGDAPGAVRRLGDALVRNPEHADALYLLSQAAEAAGAEEVAARLRNRLCDVLPAGDRTRLGIERRPDVEDQRVAFIVSAGLDQFLDDIIRELLPRLNARKFVVRTERDIAAAMAWADTCWFEWVNQPVIWASRQVAAGSKPIVTRLHRYEAFTDMPLKVNWRRVDNLVVVAEHLGDIVTELVPGFRKQTAVTHIPNGVDVDRYPFTERSPGFDIAFVGYLHGRKNPGLALQVLARLVEEDDRYRLHVAGTFQDQALRLYWMHQVTALGLENHVVMHPWQDDVAAFLADKHYLLSTSTHESFGYSIAEAMACGIKPVVHNFPFAASMWAEEMLFNTVEEAVRMIRSDAYSSRAYRAFVEEHYGLERQVEAIYDVLVSANKPARDEHRITEILSLQPATVNAELKCRCPVCRTVVPFQVQTVVGVPVGRESCAHCRTALFLDHDAYEQALLELSDRPDLDSVEVHRTLRNVAAGLGTDPLWLPVLTTDGIPIGQTVEFDLTKHLVAAHLAAARRNAA